MLDAINEARRINEVRSIKEVGDVKELVTPEQVANFLKTSKRAKMVLRKTISEQSMEWVLYWLDNTLWPDPPVPVLNQDTLRHGAQPQSFLKQEQKNSVSSEQGHKTSYIDLVCHPQGAAINIDQSVQRSVACPDVGALRAPKRRVPSKRRFDQTLDLSGISNLDPGPSLKAPRLSLPDNKQKPDVQMQMPVFVPFSGPPLASQPVPANYPVKPTVPDCKITWVSKHLEQTLPISVMLTPKRFQLNTVDRLRTLCGRNVFWSVKRACLTSRSSHRPGNQSHRSYPLWHHKVNLTVPRLFVVPRSWRRFLWSVLIYSMSYELSLNLSEGLQQSLIATIKDGMLDERGVKKKSCR